jgi:LPXTG-site transpeptidase (sortase) family protein
LALKTSRKLLKKAKKLILKKPRSKAKRRLLRNAYILLSFGILLLAFGGFNYYRVRILSFTTLPTVAPTKDRGAVPTEIVIPSIKIDLPVDIGEIKNGVWQISTNHATFLNTSAPPGTGGNTVIYGHNKKVIFGNLPYLSVGQDIYVKTSDGKIHAYKAVKKYFVEPEAVNLISPTTSEELTIYTCWGLFDSQRAVIKALPI